jgi:hypothetical protein
MGTSGTWPIQNVVRADRIREGMKGFTAKAPRNNIRLFRNSRESHFTAEDAENAEKKQ